MRKTQSLLLTAILLSACSCDSGRTSLTWKVRYDKAGLPTSFTKAGHRKTRRRRRVANRIASAQHWLLPTTHDPPLFDKPVAEYTGGYNTVLVAFRLTYP